MHKDPIKLSLISICVVTLLSLLVISKCKPECTVDLDSDKNSKINWGKSISLSLMIGIVTGIVVFLCTMKKATVVPEKTPDAVMKFSNKVSNAY
jgi:cellobiose-specific phosphotransferase system component IIC